MNINLLFLMFTNINYISNLFLFIFIYLFIYSNVVLLISAYKKYIMKMNTLYTHKINRH
jgi:hypothetical protein